MAMKNEYLNRRFGWIDNIWIEKWVHAILTRNLEHRKLMKHLKYQVGEWRSGFIEDQDLNISISKSQTSDDLFISLVTVYYMKMPSVVQIWYSYGC